MPMLAHIATRLMIFTFLSGHYLVVVNGEWLLALPAEKPQRPAMERNKSLLHPIAFHNQSIPLSVITRRQKLHGTDRSLVII